MELYDNMNKIIREINTTEHEITIDDQGALVLN